MRLSKCRMMLKGRIAMLMYRGQMQVKVVKFHIQAVSGVIAF